MAADEGNLRTKGRQHEAGDVSALAKNDLLAGIMTIDALIQL